MSSDSAAVRLDGFRWVSGVKYSSRTGQDRTPNNLSGLEELYARNGNLRPLLQVTPGLTKTGTYLVTL